MPQVINRLGSLFAGSAAIPPQNEGLNRYAQARLDNIVSRAVRRHENALRVDGIKLHLWVRRNGGLICTCRDPKKPVAREQIQPANNEATNDQLREPMTEQYAPDQDGPGVQFQIINYRGKHDVGFPSDGTPIPPEFAGVDAVSPNIDGSPQEHLDSEAPLSAAEDDISDDELARMLSSGGAISGGDKTPCGICYSTGRTHGYEYFSGRRLVLDASNEWIFSINGPAQVSYKFRPAKFRVNSSVDCAVSWVVDLPSFTTGWLVTSVRDNLKPANNLKIQWFLGGTWQDLTTALLLSNEGIDRTQQQIRVISDGTLGLGDWAEFTHVDLTYSTAAPVLSQCAPFTLSTNYEILQPDLNVEFEILGSVDEITRETVFQDEKYMMLWKVIDSTPKMTAQHQVFVYNVTARNVKLGEPLLAMKVLFDSITNYNYRGLERDQGDLYQKYWPESKNVPNNMTLPETMVYQYNTEDS